MYYALVIKEVRSPPYPFLFLSLCPAAVMPRCCTQDSHTSQCGSNGNTGDEDEEEPATATTLFFLCRFFFAAEGCSHSRDVPFFTRVLLVLSMLIGFLSFRRRSDGAFRVCPACACLRCLCAKFLIFTVYLRNPLANFLMNSFEFSYEFCCELLREL